MFEVIVSAVGGFISILLIIISYFLREFHKDVKGMKVGFQELTDKLGDLNMNLVRTEEKGRSGYNILKTRVDDHGRRIGKLEHKVDKK